MIEGVAAEGELARIKFKARSAAVLSQTLYDIGISALGNDCGQ